MMNSKNIESIQNHIGGQWVASRSGNAVDARSPSSGALLAKVASGDRADAQQAISAARMGHENLARLTNWERAALCNRVADEMEKRRDGLATALAEEQGKPITTEAYPEVDAAITGFREAAELVKWMEGDVIPAETPGKRVISFRQARGVYGVITPWNFPVNIPVEYLAPCLAAGNGVVWVPSPSTAICAARLMECIVAAELPDGAINLVFGPGNLVGDEIVTNPGTHGIGLTGSPKTGKIVAARGAGKPMILELGGNGPLIILDDADLDKAAAAAAFGAFFNSGQVCAATGRVLVTKANYEAVAQKIAEHAGLVKVGNPLLPDTTMGPLHNAEVMQKVQEHVSDGVSRGAEVMAGGSPLTGQNSDLFFAPTVLGNVALDALANTSETFGPVVPIIICDDEEQMLLVANASEQGLATAVFTKDLSKAFRFGEALQSGLVNINSPTCYWELHIPFGGAAGKQSGLGRIGGKHMLAEVTQVKTITFDIN
jgi:acyl-CoA reductase-like NAD-dependent aldehyde dehydrogenase